MADGFFPPVIFLATLLGFCLITFMGDFLETNFFMLVVGDFFGDFIGMTLMLGATFIVFETFKAFMGADGDFTLVPLPNGVEGPELEEAVGFARFRPVFLTLGVLGVFGLAADKALEKAPGDRAIPRRSTRGGVESAAMRFDLRCGVETSSILAGLFGVAAQRDHPGLNSRVVSDKPPGDATREPPWDVIAAGSIHEDG